ncbi:MAG TPA: hypothetical protein VGQ48_01085 [Gemmatimonadales bacterium]|jgi:hypothetical protein|nr:hypothetical protein [Gemmatimonadales bacterium]
MNRTLLVLALTVAALPAAAQGRGPKKEFVVAPNRAVIAARDVLVSRGFEVIRMEVRGNDRVLFYRRGNMGRGKGQGPPMTLIIRQMRDRVVFVDTPDAVLVDINLRLKL